MAFGVICDHRFEEHQNPSGHPESPERIRILQSLLDRWGERVHRVDAVPGEVEWIERVHDTDLVERIQSTVDGERTFDLDTFAGPGSWDALLLSIGAAAELLQLLASGEVSSGFLLSRPPGHHAERNRAMGFCLFNIVAVAARFALDSGIARRVAIVDFDVHHGNGTQEIFYPSRDVLYISSHQYPFYPGTGSLYEAGAGKGEGLTLNLPVSAGADDPFYLLIYREIVAPVLREYEPDLILISAGYDAHHRDPLAGMHLTTGGFSALVKTLNDLALEAAGGRILYLLEGGYNLEALAACVARTIEVCLGAEADEIDLEETRSDFAHYRSQIARVQGSYWGCLSEDGT